MTVNEAMVVGKTLYVAVQTLKQENKNLEEKLKIVGNRIDQLATENERLKKQVELLKSEAVERLINTCSFEVKFNVRDSE